MCKRGFPTKVIKTHCGTVRQETYRVRVVYQGVAGQLDLKTSGRRNALGSFAGRRRCERFVPRSATVAQLFRSSTNAQCTCRVPIAELTHDKDWSSKSRIKQGTPRQLCLVPQRAVKQMTGYFGGYLAKRQKLGASDLKKSVAALAPAKRNCIRVNCARGEPHVRHFGRQGRSPGMCGRIHVVLAQRRATR